MSAECNPQRSNPEKATGGCDAIARGCVSCLDDFASLWQLAFDASSDMISILDMHHRIIAINQAMAGAIGCDPDQAVGRYCHTLMHRTAEPPKTCPHNALLKDGCPHHADIYEERLDAWLQIRVIPLYDADRHLVGSIHIARDITRQKRTEQAHKESEERYRHLSEATVEGVLLSENSTIIAANQVLADMTGYAVQEMIGMKMFKLVAPGHRNRLISALRDRRDGAHIFDCIRKDGTLFSIEAHTRAISYKGKTVYQTAIRDLTEQIRIEKERIQHARMRGVLEMAGAVCHEINQPLMALQGYMEILAARLKLEANAAEHLDKMDAQIERIKNLTHKIMRIAKYETKDYAGGEKIIDIDQSARHDGNPPLRNDG